MTQGIIESSPLDDVKRQYFNDFQACRVLLFEINRKRAKTPELTNFGSNESRFKAGVLNLYDACRPKFQNHADNASVKKLIEIEPRIDSRFTLKEAEQVFKLLTDLLEVSGITRFEKEFGQLGVKPPKKE